MQLCVFWCHSWRVANYFRKKSTIVDVQLGSKYASANVTLHLTFFRRTLFIETWWNFLRCYLKQNKILSMRLKDKSCNSPEGLQLYQEETPAETNFKKRKLVKRLRLPLLELDCFMYIYKSNRSTTKTAFVFLAKFAKFYYHKIFETRSQWRLKRLCGWT